MNPSEGRVPVSWNECADWLEAVGFVRFDDPVNRSSGTYYRGLAKEVRAGAVDVPLSAFRLLPPPNLVAAPEGMDGGGWLGQGKDVPDGWEWRRLTGIQAYAPGTARPTVDWIVQCRPPAPKREPEWVPLTKLVGRTVWEQKEPVETAEVTSAGQRWWSSESPALPFPDGTLDLDTGRVKVEPEEEQ